MTQISSARHPLFKQWKDLVENASERRRRECLVAEGPHLVDEALKAGLAAKEALVTGTFEKDSRHQALIEKIRGLKIPMRQLSAGLMSKLSQTQAPQGVLLVCSYPKASNLSQWLGSPGDLAVVAHGLQDPGNLGTLLRCCWAAGCSGLVLTGEGADPWSGKALRAGAGAQFQLPCLQTAQIADVLGPLKAHGLHLVAATVRGQTDYLDLKYQRPVCLILGAEGQGLPAEVEGFADENVRISYPGNAESLNVAVSGAVFLFEILRQRRKTL